MKKRAKIIVLLCAALLFAVILIVAVVLRKSYEEQVQQIYTDILEIKLSKAYLEYQKAVRMDPERPEAHEAYAALLMVRGDYEQVEQILVDCLKQAKKKYAEESFRGEDIARITNRLAGYYVQWKRIEDAIAILRDVPQEYVTDEIAERLEILSGKKVLLLQDYVIEWKDSRMEAAVRTLLEKPEGEIRASEVWNITTLEIWGNEVITEKMNVSGYDQNGFWLQGKFVGERGEIRSLEDLRHFENLEALSINFQEELSLDFFLQKKLSRLRKISLVNDGIQEISDLMWYNRLTGLVLDYNKIREFMWVSRMEVLNELSVCGNPAFWSMEDLDGMGNLRALNVLEVPEVDFEKIVKIQSLEELKIDAKADFSELKNCENLRKLTITADEEIMKQVLQIPKLYELEVTLRGRAQLLGLENLGYLRNVTIENQGIGALDLQALAKLPDLREVTLCEGGEFVNYAALAACQKLQRVNLASENEKMYEEVRRAVPREIIKVSAGSNH